MTCSAHILQILQQTKGVIGGRNGAAAWLGLPRTTLIAKMKRLGIKLGQSSVLPVRAMASVPNSEEAILRIPTASGISNEAARSGNSKPDSDLGRVCTLAEAEREHATDDSSATSILRLVLGIVFFAHGAQKMFGWFGGPGFSGTIGFFTSMMHIPAPLASMEIATEFFGGIGLILGFLTRIAAFGIGGVGQPPDFLAGSQVGKARTVNSRPAQAKIMVCRFPQVRSSFRPFRPAPF